MKVAFIFTAIIITVAVVLLGAGIYKLGMMRERARARERMMTLEADNKKLRSDNHALEASEPEKVKYMREEIVAHDQLLDRLLIAVTEVRSPLDLDNLANKVANMIEAGRPVRKY